MHVYMPLELFGAWRRRASFSPRLAPAMPSLLEKCALIAGAVGIKQAQLAALLEEQGAAGVLAARAVPAVGRRVRARAPPVRARAPPAVGWRVGARARPVTARALVASERTQLLYTFARE